MAMENTWKYTTVWDRQLEYDPYELMALDWVPDKSIQSEILPGKMQLEFKKMKKKQTTVRI